MDNLLIDNAPWLNLAVALGIGLLIGAERERSKDANANMTLAGIRTFSIVSLMGAVSVFVNFWLLVASVASVTTFAAIAYVVRGDKHPGLTTEVTLILTLLLGGLAMSAPALAASLSVTASILLAAKEPIHGFVRGTITKDELNDFLILAAATLIVLPLVPNYFIGPFDAINPRNLWLIVILVMFISALGHIALRLLGGRVGLPIVGLVSGFISSIATIGAMGERAKESPALIASSLAGAVLSCLSTILQLTLLLAAIHRPTLQAMAIPLAFGGVSIAMYGLVLTVSSFHKNVAEVANLNKSFSVKTAFVLALVIALVLVASAALNVWFGQAGIVFASALAGMADAHAPTISVATMAAAGKLTPANAVIPILVAFSVNAVSKMVAAFVSGGKGFALQLIPALIIQVSAAWLGWWLF